MSEFRKDPITGLWVIIAPEKALFTSKLTEVKLTEEIGFCPFCAGNEDKTPKEVYKIERNGKWSVRVVPNRFPVLKVEGELINKGYGLYDKMSGLGAHEIIIETPEHNRKISLREQYEISDLFKAYRERILDLKKDFRLKYIMIFKNRGYFAGASLSHSYSQLIATPIVPDKINEELLGSKKYYDYKHRCIFCDIIDQEIDFSERVISKNKDFIALAPYASRFPYEVMILPIKHSLYYENLNNSEIESLAEIVLDIFKRQDTYLNFPAFNMILHNYLSNASEVKHFHWHIEIFPRLTNVAGFEWGTGFYINPIAPEKVAQEYKKLLL